MTPTEFAQCRRTLGLTQRELARLLRLRPGGDRSIRHYEQGTKPVPGPVSVVLDVLCNDHDPLAQFGAVMVKKEREFVSGIVRSMPWQHGDA